MYQSKSIIIDDEISEAFALKSRKKHDCLLLLLLFIILLNAFGQEKGKEDIKYLKGGGKITIIAYGIILYLKSPKELSEK